MVASDADGPIRVAIVGSGLAGLTTAFLLQSDSRKRFEITVFEQVRPSATPEYR
jgi:protoporphyrinogen oxidase